MGRWLVLGGTRFLSAAVARAALGRGHEVVCAARGESGRVPDGATLVRVDRDEPGALDPLRGRHFDAVVDVATMSPAWVRAALDALGPSAGHWTFVSSISVYADPAPPGQTVDAPLLAPDDPDDYGSAKVASENAVREAVGDRAFVVRAGLICGPGDVSDRFGYWPLRFSRGGRVVVPASAQAAQLVDVRDLADWIVRAGEEGLGGTFDASGPRSTLAAVLAEVAAAVGAPDLELVPVADDDLGAAGVQPWAGPRSDQIAGKAVDAFNRAAPAFVKAADATRGLELQQMSPEAVSPEAAVAIADLRAATDALRVQYVLYDSVASLSGVAPAGMGSAPSVRHLLSRLAVPQHDADVTGAEELLLAYGRGGQDRYGAVLPVAFAAPFVVVPDYGMTLARGFHRGSASRCGERAGGCR